MSLISFLLRNVHPDKTTAYFKSNKQRLLTHSSLASLDFSEDKIFKLNRALNINKSRSSHDDIVKTPNSGHVLNSRQNV